MKPIDDFTNVLQSIAENKAITKDEIKKRLLSLASRMDKAGVSNLEKLAYRAIELIGEFPNNISNVMKLLVHCANEDWTKVGEAAKPLLDIKDLRELTKNVGLKTTL
ncbi:hypothetical protein [Prevotella pallens]|uniref:hypothetical protein n=1 Tax=Prevotella pallens TaxID=60133 RepID=UPI001CB4FEDE|nr:hypothetical protein [Prevotella pallens]MBF1517856.1 hypothetical protein [Prevotella pallens]